MKNDLDNKGFWKRTKHSLSDKNTMSSQISIERINKIISDDFDLSEEFSTFFEHAARSYNVKSDEYYLSEALSDPVKIAIKKFENQPSVLDIKQNILVIQNFYFSNKDVSDIL